ncbi:MAG: type II toxin-antitoxin system VapC family toxin [Candidatus Rokubacteria bacterium]|nr:type II toxin-antitoxin system VapC family toxin [Candidatus Rokubacteria bacterium]
MRFWDTSALVPLFVNERGTARAERWLRDDPLVIVWTLTRIELLSALARRRREEPAAARRLSAVRREVITAWPDWWEITTMELVRRHAERLVESHPLGAADALQLGAALVAADGDPASLEFVTFDDGQAEAAEREGFHVLGQET